VRKDGGTCKVTIPPSEIENLIHRAQQGDGVAVTRLYEAHVSMIYRYIVYRVPDSEAEDLTAEVFVKMVEGLPQYKYTGAPFEAWLYRIAAARVADYHRQEQRRRHVELSEHLPHEGPHPEERVMQSQEVNTLRAAVQQLSDDQQTVMILRFVERLSHEDVAQIMGKSTTSVKSIQHRALTQLTRILGAKKKVRHYLRGRHEGS
jgi:RNA polymerase sigma-70 factor, ECF subfamily